MIDMASILPHAMLRWRSLQNWPN